MHASTSARCCSSAARTGLPPAAPRTHATKRRGRAALLAPRAAANTFGSAFRVTTFGESHGKGVGCVVDGVPPRLPIDKAEIQAELDRRRPGQSRITTPRKESDTCEIYSGARVGGCVVGRWAEVAVFV
jgi:chorismate synthase